jgi:hypothetical protein
MYARGVSGAKRMVVSKRGSYVGDEQQLTVVLYSTQRRIGKS